MFLGDQRPSAVDVVDGSELLPHLQGRDCSPHFSSSLAVLDIEAELGLGTVTDECKEGIQGVGVN